jgi:hypothetical protein
VLSGRWYGHFQINHHFHPIFYILSERVNSWKMKQISTFRVIAPEQGKVYDKTILNELFPSWPPVTLPHSLEEWLTQTWQNYITAAHRQRSSGRKESDIMSTIKAEWHLELPLNSLIPVWKLSLICMHWSLCASLLEWENNVQLTSFRLFLVMGNNILDVLWCHYFW